MDKVFIEGLEIDALIGIYDWERRIRQTLRFDLDMGFDNRRPAASDDIADTLNYKAVSKRIEQFVRDSDYGLVETLAERIACALLESDARLLAVQVTVEKPDIIADVAGVGVTVERRRG